MDTIRLATDFAAINLIALHEITVCPSKVFEFFEAIPVTAVGKVDKKALRQAGPESRLILGFEFKAVPVLT